MKPILYSVILILTVILVGCEKTIDESELVVRKDIHYQINSDKPFTGSVFSYHDNGQVKTSRIYKKGLKEGLFEEFYDNGQLLSSVNYFMGEKEGVENIYFENGNIHFIKNYKNNLLTGVKETYFENGQVNLKEKFESGILKDFSRYDEDGNEILIFIDYWDDDYDWFLSKTSEIILKIGDSVIREGKIEGDGSIWEHFKRTTGEPFTGLVVSYYDSGELNGRGYVKNGVEHGVYETFHKSGVIFCRGNMSEGRSEGLGECFYENGNLEVQGHFINDNRVGIWKYFNEDGTFKEKKCYQNDKEVDMSFCEENNN